jgi:hypothetical protein
LLAFLPNDRILVSTSNPQQLRELSKMPDVVSEELFRVAATDHHRFAVGQRCRLAGMVDFPEFNGTEVIITAIRQDAPRGRAYYVAGEISKMCNWVYEVRLEPILEVL